jgi:copper chaperone
VTLTITGYQVSGMTCEHCARAVTQELVRLDGVSSVDVDLVPGGVSAVRVASHGSLPAAQITAALAEAGDYQLVGAATPGAEGEAS